MTYDMRFKGRFSFENHQAAQAAIGAFSHSECIEESVVRPEDCLLHDDAVEVDVDASAPATWWESTCDALGTLSEEARDGYIEAVYDPGEGPASLWRVRLLPGGEELELEDD